MKTKKMLAILVLALVVMVCAPAKSVEQLVRDFIVAPGESVSAGDVVVLINNKVRAGSPEPAPSPEYVFNGATTCDISIARLSETKLVVAYRDAGNADYGMAVVGEVAGNSITFGSEYLFKGAGCYDISVAPLSETKFVVAYRDAGNTDYGTAAVGEVVGNSISFGWEYVFNSESTYDISVAGLSETEFAVAYRDAGNADYGTAIVGEVASSSITFGSEYLFKSASTSDISVAALSETRFVVACQDDETRDGMALLGEVTGSSIAFGTESVFSGYARDISAVCLSETTFVIVFREPGYPPGFDIWEGEALVGEVSGSSITFGLKYSFDSPRTFDISAAGLSQTKFAVARYYGNNGVTAIVGSVWGNLITFGLESFFNRATSTPEIVAAHLSETRFVVAYQDAGNAGHGTAVVSDIGGVALGVADAAASEGQSVPVIIHGISAHHSMLAQGMIYYVQPDWSLTPEPTGIRVGVAISPTELLVDVER